MRFRSGPQGHLAVRNGGIIYGTRAGWDAMKAQGEGHIIGIANGSSFRGYLDEVIYCAGSMALRASSKSSPLRLLPTT